MVQMLKKQDIHWSSNLKNVIRFLHLNSISSSNTVKYSLFPFESINPAERKSDDVYFIEVHLWTSIWFFFFNQMAGRMYNVDNQNNFPKDGWWFVVIIGHTNILRIAWENQNVFISMIHFSYIPIYSVMSYTSKLYNMLEYLFGGHIKTSSNRFAKYVRSVVKNMK